MNQSVTIHYKECKTKSTLLSRVESCTANRIIIQVQEDESVDFSFLDLLLLQRCARKNLSRLAIVTKSKSINRKAAVLGLPVFTTLPAAKRGVWRRNRNKGQAAFIHNASIVPLNREDFTKLRYKVAEKKTGRTEKHQNSHIDVIKQNHSEKNVIGNKKTRQVIRITLIAFVGISILALLSLLLPDARVRLHLQEKEQRTALEIHANPQIDTLTLAGSIPLIKEKVTLDQDGQIQGTGNLLVEDSKSEGIVEFTNLTNESVVIPMGTVVMALSEPVIRFRTTEQVLVPAGIGETATVEIEAMGAGTVGNVNVGEVTAFAGSTGLYVSVTNPELIEGGTEKISVYPNENDYQKLKKSILNQMTEDALLQLGGNLSEGEIIPGSVTYEIIEETRYPEAGEPADQLYLSMKVEFTGYSFCHQDVEELARSVLDANMDAGYMTTNDHLQITTLSDPEWNEDAEKASWEISASRNIRQEISSDLVYDLVGKSVNNAVDLIQSQYQLTESPDISINFGNPNRLPYFSSRISLEIE